MKHSCHTIMLLSSSVYAGEEGCFFVPLLQGSRFSNF